MYTYTDEMYHAAMNVLDARADQLGYEDGDELYHHGILGMKWGVRRYQNEDGSLTPEGERRYGEYSKGDKLQLKNVLTKMEAEQGLIPWVGPIGYAAGSLLNLPGARKENMKYHNMTDEEADAYEAEAKQKMQSRYKAGKTLLGSGFGALAGGLGGSLGAIGLSKLGVDDPTVAAGGMLASMLVGGAAGGAIANKTADKSFNKKYDKWTNDPDLNYYKRSKKQLAEYDREHGTDNAHDS